MAIKSPSRRSADSSVLTLLERYGPALVFLAGAILLVFGVYLALNDKDSASFVFAGAALAGVGAMSRIIESFKAAGVEVKLRNYAIADALAQVRDEVVLSSAETSTDGGGLTQDPEATADVLSSAVEALRSDDPRSEPPAVIRTHSYAGFRAAVQWVMGLERLAGRDPRLADRSEGGDIVSLPRRIEVKVVRPSSPWIILSKQLMEAARSDADFWVYLVYWSDDAAGPLEVRAVGGDALKSWAESAREQCTYRLPLRRPEVDSAERVS